MIHPCISLCMHTNYRTNLLDLLVPVMVTLSYWNYVSYVRCVECNGAPFLKSLNYVKDV